MAEELLCDDVTSGASNDLERATKMAREMVTRLGMSEELGTQVFGEAQHQVFLGRDYADHQDYSEETARRIDSEVQRIMREAHERAKRILTERRAQLELMADVLLERETVEGEAVEALLDGTWDAYLEREAAGDVKGGSSSTGSTARRKPRQSDEEIAAEAARFAEEAMASEGNRAKAATMRPRRARSRRPRSSRARGRYAPAAWRACACPRQRAAQRGGAGCTSAAPPPRCRLRSCARTGRKHG